MTPAPASTTEAAIMELIRKKNITFSVKTGGKSWACKICPRDEYEKSRAARAARAASVSSIESAGNNTPQTMSTASSLSGVR